MKTSSKHLELCVAIVSAQYVFPFFVVIIITNGTFSPFLFSSKLLLVWRKLLILLIYKLPYLLILLLFLYLFNRSSSITQVCNFIIWKQL